ncbi:endoglucanase [Fibrisoma limi BUZ 3]|uniref:Endoglucanase n=1 Tax=Fibrisoma limi BUZ 3 TaxID=1185876 RepID=I2GHQ5_9BACT|nr:cellulase family glycosylhydrolase [Fibrisoma limi]CCH53430.1 endoglucanase [Fibrisoma limi BUZ 3]
MKQYALLCLFATLPLLVKSQQTLREVPASRYEQLKNGINIDNWLVRNKTTGVLAPTQYTESDLKLIRQAGFRHVRFPIRSVLMDEQHPETLNRQDMDSIKAVLNLMLKNGLAVVFNPVHPAREYTARLEADTAMQTAFIRFWTALAREVSTYDPERLFIEPMNEPFFKSQAVWDTFNGRLLRAIRRVAPTHTLVVTPVKGNQDVADMQPVDDRNVVYSTHCYSPFGFTHQGAPWLRYTLPTGQHYPTSQWTIDFIRKDFFDRVLAWAKTNQVRLYLGEYGVLNTADYNDRVAWLTDLGTIIRENQLASALWCYGRASVSPSFSTLEKNDAPASERKFDDKLLNALQLK